MMKLPDSKLTAFMVGENKVMAGIATIIFNEKDDLPSDLSHSHHKYLIGGAIITDADYPIDKHWSMMECEVIIIPKKMFSGWNRGGGAEMVNILLNRYAHPESWEKEVKLP